MTKKPGKLELALLLAGGLLFCSLAVRNALADISASDGVAIASLGVGAVEGRVTDAQSGDPIPWVDVHFLDGPHLEFTDGDGRYHIRGVKPGPHPLQFSRIGYETATHEVVIAPGDTAYLVLALEPRPIELDEARIQGRHAGPGIHEADRSVDLRARDLASKLGGTIAATLADEPGLAERTMGPAPARPVVRGLSGERLLVLEDGASTGDLSATSPDHAVLIDPMSAQRVEVVRGPAALAFGSSVLGGVVNVDRGYVPSAPLDAVHGRVQTQGESVSRSRALQAEVGVPWRDHVVHASVSLRGTEDVQTPVGEVGNTAVDSKNGSLGISRFGRWGYAGIAASYFDTEYGVPGGFLGGHPNGADILVDRRHVSARAELLPAWTGVESLELQGTYARYFQEEQESNGACGVSFGVLSYESRVQLNFDADAPGPLGAGSVGLSYRHRDYASACFTFTPPAIERSSGAFLYQRRTLGAWELGAAARIDHRRVEPAYVDTNKAGAIRDRDFTGGSASLSASRALGRGVRLESVASRSFRSPAVEELFSDGPHLAAFAFEVGNADLGTEAGLGIDLTLGWDGELPGGPAGVELTGYVNEVDGYIHAVDTGEIEFGAGEDGFLARWRFEGVDARFVGVEGRADVSAGQYDVSATAAFVRGTSLADDLPLPLVPPLSLRIQLERGWGSVRSSLVGRGATRQARTGPFETETASYIVWDAALEWSHLGDSALHGVVLRLENAADAEYRNHLSRIRSILPESGRNVALLYRLSF